MDQMCDQTDCKERATHSYTWEWGASGVCCAKHQMVLAQTAASLQRQIHFSPINDGAAPPLQREERVKLRAEALVLGEELEEAKLRGLELYRQNTQLISQVQSLTVRAREQEAQLRDAVKARDDLDLRVASLESENATLHDELGRLRVLVDLPPAASGGFDPTTSPGVGPA